MEMLAKVDRQFRTLDGTKSSLMFSFRAATRAGGNSETVFHVFAFPRNIYNYLMRELHAADRNE
jgi:hypothetical protein